MASSWAVRQWTETARNCGSWAIWAVPLVHLTSIYQGAQNINCSEPCYLFMWPLAQIYVVWGTLYLFIYNKLWCITTCVSSIMLVNKIHNLQMSFNMMPAVFKESPLRFSAAYCFLLRLAFLGTHTFYRCSFLKYFFLGKCFITQKIMEMQSKYDLDLTHM